MALQMHSGVGSGNEHLFNTAAIQTLLNGGMVYTAEPAKVSKTELLVAVLRY